MPSNNPVSLWDLSKFFLKLGFISFGGPVAHIALMEEELVRKRKWISPERFLDFVGAVNLIPGPNSTEVVLHIGYQHRGFVGLLVSGMAFILPAFCMVLGLSWLYTLYGTLPEVSKVMHFMQAAIMALILQAMIRLFRTLAHSKMLAAIALLTAGIHLLGVREIPALFLGATFVLGLRFFDNQKNGLRFWSLDPLTIFFVFLKIGSVVFGSGYVLFVFLKGEFVERYGWISDSQLLDAITVGQITPGPLFTSAAFIGYLLQGTLGAVLATVGIFLPAFILVAISGPLIPRIRASRNAGAFLDGLNAASLGLMSVVSLKLATETLVDGINWAIFIAAVIWIFGFRKK